GRLTLLAGAPLAGAPLELQQLDAGSPSTVTMFATAADGSWSATLALSRNAALRVLHRVAPAAVSDVALIGVLPVLTLSLESQSPLRVMGTVNPVKRTVWVDVYQRVGVTNGRFSQKLGLKRAGPYVVVARTRADADNLAGTSPPLSVSV